MSTLSLSDFRAKLANYCDKVAETHKPIHVMRGRNKPGIVVMSEEYYDAMQETFYLMKSPKNARRLLRSVEAVDNKKFKERPISE